MLLHIIKRYKPNEGLSCIFVQNEEGTPVAFYMNEKQLGVFLEKTAVVLGIRTESTKEQGYKEINYRTNKDVFVHQLAKPECITGNVLEIRTIVGMFEVDVHLVVEEDKLIVYKPHITRTDGFNPVPTNHVDFVNEFGSIQFID
ncbi:hypothetical protein [Bacillus toyonensis]|uniref:hypothetical protein n=1 Tax=Bacillus toyonensis TaxID=155322 RepID=UPI000BF2E281|nr:hypothetical protein [Bacillus toyonensis]PGF04975.1 hypothetical protein COM61_00610 [Bacillus toyonensis]